MHPQGKKRWNGGGHHAVWKHNIVTPGQNEHPTQKPINLLVEWINLFTDPSEIVLDPYCGSGSTLVACAKLGRKGIGIEIEEKYFDIACRRVEDAYRQGDMLQSLPPLPKAQQVAFSLSGEPPV